MCSRWTEGHGKGVVPGSRDGGCPGAGAGARPHTRTPLQVQAAIRGARASCCPARRPRGPHRIARPGDHVTWARHDRPAPASHGLLAPGRACLRRPRSHLPPLRRAPGRTFLRGVLAGRTCLRGAGSRLPSPCRSRAASHGLLAGRVAPAFPVPPAPGRACLRGTGSHLPSTDRSHLPPTGCPRAGSRLPSPGCHLARRAGSRARPET